MKNAGSLNECAEKALIVNRCVSVSVSVEHVHRRDAKSAELRRGNPTYKPMTTING
jgi:hypothetical protein